MADKNKDIVINVHPFNCEVKTTSNGFILKFVCPIKGTFTRRKIVNLHFENWWLKYIAKQLWRVIKKRRADVEELERGMIEHD